MYSVGSMRWGDAAAARARARDDIVRNVHRPLALTVGPATLPPTGESVENGLPPEAMPRLTEIELGARNFNEFTTLARAAVPAVGARL